MSFDGFATSINTVHRTGRLRLSVDGRGQETPQPARSPFAARRNCTMRLCGLRTRGRWSCGGPTNREHTGLQVLSRSSERSVRVGVSVYTRSPCGGCGIGTFFDDCPAWAGVEDVIAARSSALYHSASFSKTARPSAPGLHIGRKICRQHRFRDLPVVRTSALRFCFSSRRLSASTRPPLKSSNGRRSN